MKIEWQVNQDDILRVKEFVDQQENYFVEYRRKRNVLRENIVIDKDTLIRGICMCLLTTQQRSGPYSPVAIFLRQKPFPITYDSVQSVRNLREYFSGQLIAFGLKRYVNKIPEFFSSIIAYLENTNWEIINSLKTLLNADNNKEKERAVADTIAKSFKGFGPKQARNFLIFLGLTKFEVPIDSRTIKRLDELGFPIHLSPIGLQDTYYYHFISDGIQMICEKAGIYPCILDAAIFSSFDNGQYNEETNAF